MFRVIAFYTKNTPYEVEIGNLETSLNKLGIKYHFEGYEARGSWVRNCAIKPEFLRDMLDKFPDDDLLYVDADAVFVAYPKYFDTFVGDFGVHEYHGRELLSGTIFLHNNDKVGALINMWITEQIMFPEKWDQKVLAGVLAKQSKNLGLQVTNIPAGCVKIFDRDPNVKDVCIVHNQASRRFKNLVKDIGPEKADNEPAEKVLKSDKSKVKAVYDNVRVRWLADGSFMLPRANDRTTQMLDMQFIRVKNEKRWYPISLENAFTRLIPIFTDHYTYIVGKGPSLDYLTEADFPSPYIPIIAINQAIHKVESLNIQNPIFCMQQDSSIKSTCLPKRGTMLISAHSSRYYKDLLPPERLFIFSPYTFYLNINSLTVKCAISFARECGSKEIVLLCFDASMPNGSLEYAKCIGHSSKTGGNPNRFLTHRRDILRITRGCNIEFRWPKNHVA
ncbi:MAG: hypothetical protein M0R80_26670 [Proteobacteria bacterium]|jgi:hypothetical protein|nr:hypothetical protein [Pseudomonadota bacterium]